MTCAVSDYLLYQPYSSVPETIITSMCGSSQLHCKSAEMPIPSTTLEERAYIIVLFLIDIVPELVAREVRDNTDEFQVAELRDRNDSPAYEAKKRNAPGEQVADEKQRHNEKQ